MGLGWLGAVGGRGRGVVMLFLRFAFSSLSASSPLPSFVPLRVLVRPPAGSVGGVSCRRRRRRRLVAPPTSGAPRRAGRPVKRQRGAGRARQASSIEPSPALLPVAGKRPSDERSLRFLERLTSPARTGRDARPPAVRGVVVGGGGGSRARLVGRRDRRHHPRRGRCVWHASPPTASSYRLANPVLGPLMEQSKTTSLTSSSARRPSPSAGRRLASGSACSPSPSCLSLGRLAASPLELNYAHAS
jgi:hypothetical protein